MTKAELLACFSRAKLLCEFELEQRDISSEWRHEMQKDRRLLSELIEALRDKPLPKFNGQIFIKAQNKRHKASKITKN